MKSIIKYITPPPMRAGYTHQIAAYKSKYFPSGGSSSSSCMGLKLITTGGSKKSDNYQIALRTVASTNI